METIITQLIADIATLTTAVNNLPAALIAQQTAQIAQLQTADTAVQAAITAINAIATPSAGS